MITPRGMSAAVDGPRLLVGLLRAGDMALVVVSGFASYRLRHEHLALPDYYVVGIVIGALVAANAMQFAGVYSIRSLLRLNTQIGQLAAGWGAILVCLTLISYFTKTSQEFSRLWLAVWVAFSFVLMLIVRIVVHWQLVRWQRMGRLKISIAIVGATELALRLIRQVRGQEAEQYRLVGVYDDRATRVPPAFAELGVRRAGAVSDLVARFREEPIDEIVLALPWSESQRIKTILQELRTLPTSVRLCPETVGFELPVHGFSTVAGVPMLGIFERPLAGWSVVAKAIEDRVAGALVLLLMAPLMFWIAVAIKVTSPGPVLFGQRRYGFNNNEFVLYKFRTMVADAARDEGVVPQATRNDPRVTRLGAFLRRTSLDELPQLFNVLKGDMSMVGPRPHAIVHNQQFATLIDDYLSRHRVKPGMTGWAQVNGLRGEIDSPQKIQLRVQYDLYYIDHWSLLFDLKILLLTLFVGFVNENAY
ncbi:MAG TPA: undecaprenyl-phosphate glucose phosphotransferase [Alphaproteobacteria bacterium]|nr:undecaprenyl-phosphate glucose phosphotransferase [Alphaproteobacteria bacterium]